MKKTMAPTARLTALILSLLFLLSGFVSLTPVTAADATTLTIYHTNDIHGAFAPASNTIGADDLAGLKAANPQALLLDAGDAVQGLTLVSLSQGAAAITLMNAAGYDASALGNHDFDYGLDALLANAVAADFPFLAANVLKEDQRPLLAGTTYAGGTKENNGAYTIVDVDGLKVGIFGLTTPESTYKVKPSLIAGLTFADPLETAKTTIATLQGEGAEVIICLAHLGVASSTLYQNRSTGLAQELGANSGLDIIIDGHSHHQFTQSINGILIQQTGTGSVTTGNITLTHSQTGNEISSRLIPAQEIKETVTPVASVTQAIQAIQAENAVKTAPVIGQTATSLWGGNINTISEGRLFETNLGDLVADAILEEGKSLLTESQSTYQNAPMVALTNSGGIRASLPRGEITVGSIIDVLPFANTLAIKAITPKVLYAVLENGLSKITGQDPNTGLLWGPDGRFPQIAGMTVTYDPTALSGSRVQSIVLDGSTTTLNPEDDTTPLTLVSSDFIVSMGDGYDMLSDLPMVAESADFESIVQAKITSLTQENGPIQMETWGHRIIPAGSYAPADYTVTIPVSLAAGEETVTLVEYALDGGIVQQATLNDDGALTLTLTHGPHTLRVGDAADVLVNNYTGQGTLVPVTVALTDPLINHPDPSPSVSPAPGSTPTAAAETSVVSEATSEERATAPGTGLPGGTLALPLLLLFVAGTMAMGIFRRQKQR